MKNGDNSMRRDEMGSKNADYIQEYIAKHQPQFDRLSKKEIRLITLVSEGSRSEKIVSSLGISEVEYEELRANISQKLSLQTESDYIKFALAFGLISF
ncbi:MAG: hypothetical protein WD053_09605 [Gracilimonas sp.]